MITNDELRSAIAAIIDPHAFAPIRDDVEEPFRGMIGDDRKLALSRATRITELLASRASETGVSEAMVEAALEASEPLLFGPDTTAAHMAASPLSVDFARAPFRTRMRAALEAAFALSPAAQGEAEPVGDWQRTVKYLLARCEDYDGTRMSDGAEPMGVTCATLRGAAKAIEGLAATVSHQHEVVVLEREARIKAEAALPHPSISTSISAGRDEGLEAAAKIAERGAAAFARSDTNPMRQGAALMVAAAIRSAKGSRE